MKETINTQSIQPLINTIYNLNNDNVKLYEDSEKFYFYKIINNITYEEVSVNNIKNLGNLTSNTIYFNYFRDLSIGNSLKVLIDTYTDFIKLVNFIEKRK